MVKKIVISELLNRVQIGIIENGRLVEYYLERNGQEGLVGNIYKGRVENILPGMEAAFVDLGVGKNAFLYVADIMKREPQQDIKDILKKGESILVQVLKEAAGSKGSRVTTEISLPGRYLVLLPFQEHFGVSRQIVDEEERTRLKEMAGHICPPHMGLIVRTVAEGCRRAELEEDLEFLLHEWEAVEKEYEQSSAPALIYEDKDLLHRILRDLLTADVSEILVDGKELHSRVEDEIKAMGANYPIKVERYLGKLNLFEYLGLLKDLERARNRKVWLNCGGYLIFDQTEALLSIDVNTGKYVGGQDLRATVLKTNVQAAKEIAHQLRLRNVGGIVVIDFIDMPREDREIVLDKMSQSLGGDKTQTNLLGFTELGLLEMTRRKNRKLLSHILDVPCPLCQGSGRVAADETVALEIAGKIRSLAREDEVEAILVKCHSAVGAHLIGPEACNLAILEKETGRSVYVRGDDLYQRHHYELISGDVSQISRQAQPVEVGERIRATILEPCAKQAQNGVARLNGFVIHCLQCGSSIGRTVELEIIEVLKTCAIARLVE